MEIITLEAKVFKALMEKLDLILKFVNHVKKEEIQEGWVDSNDVCMFLKISSRTLQRLRSKRLINYSIMDGKTYYKISEIKRILADRVIRSKEEYLKDLIENYNRNAGQNKYSGENE